MQKRNKKKDPDAVAETTEKTRRCLMCGKPFPSSWAGERICRRCKSTAAWRSG